MQVFTHLLTSQVSFSGVRIDFCQSHCQLSNSTPERGSDAGGAVGQGLILVLLLMFCYVLFMFFLFHQLNCNMMKPQITKQARTYSCFGSLFWSRKPEWNRCSNRLKSPRKSQHLFVARVAPGCFQEALSSWKLTYHLNNRRLKTIIFLIASFLG